MSRICRVARFINLTVHGIFGARTMWKIVGLAGFTVGLWLHFRFSFLTSIAATFGVYLATGGWQFTRVFIKTLPRDLRGLTILLMMKMKISRIEKQKRNLITVFQENVKRHPDKYAFVSVDTGRHMTFRDVDEYSNAAANYFYQSGFRAGDVIAIFMENCPEYACLWLGMAKIGAHAALVNFNLRDESLIHCLTISDAKAIIYNTNLADAIKDIDAKLPSEMKMFTFGDQPLGIEDEKHLGTLIQASSTSPPPKPPRSSFHDKLFYIYTSGTTGLPKAAIVSQSRYYYMSSGPHYFFRIASNDIIYDVLPLYHTAGGILGVGQTLIYGCTLVLRKKFSASRFWDDCIKYNCTVAQYIGELCRYLLVQPTKLSDTSHRVRVAFGNGLRPQIWVQFKERFGIETIGEFYGATEGNANIINIDNTVGSVGFATRIAPALYPVNLIKIDEATAEPLRGRNGLCIICQPGERGELVGKIVKGDPIRSFDGYANKDATSKKIAFDCFSKGDSVFLTGDVLVMDEYGNMFFQDRTGDTFRWRGENVSTSEVEATISNIIKLNDAVVYGVEVPGSEGRAGMAAIVDENGTIELDTLYTKISTKLPPYARPLFIRILGKVDQTGTFKLKKVDYRKEGFNPNKVSDKMFYLDARAGLYKPLTVDAFEDIQLGKIRL